MTNRALAFVGSFLLLFAGCTTHQTNACLPSCGSDPGFEEFFAECVAFGGGPGQCRPGNRMCCALSAGCVGPIGDQTVISDSSCTLVELSGCFPPCITDEAVLRYELARCRESGSPMCSAGDVECCARTLQCVGELDGVIIRGAVDGEVCCATDEACDGDEYCDLFTWRCVEDDCDACREPRLCSDGVCSCRDSSGAFVRQCPPGQVCGGDGVCIPIDPCAGVSCPTGQVCSRGECHTPCGSGCPTGQVCFAGLCVPDTSPPPTCTSDADCVTSGAFCLLETHTCQPCEPAIPDGCDDMNTDCDDMVDEDCPSFTCGDGIAQDDEPCDTYDVRGARCADRGYASGYLVCAPDCSGIVEERCSTEVCGNEADDDENGFWDCDDPACRSDPFCCLEEREICNGVDDDCDFDIDEGCGGAEDCTNGVDDDGDTLADCDDPSCAIVCCERSPRVGMPCGSDVGPCVPGTYICTPAGLTCTGVEPTPELCNGIDDDCDGFIDDRPDADLDCDDFNECTEDICLPSMAFCGWQPVSPGTPCTGGFCTSEGVCR